VLAEGSLIERLNRDPSVELDAHVLHAGMIYTPRGREVLGAMFRQYLDIGRSHGLPMILGTPTWRANPTRLRAAGFEHDRDVNGDGHRFMAEIRDGYGGYGEQVYIGGLMGCVGDAYKPSEALTAEEAADFHRPQARALAEAGVDYLLAATLPAACEALGMARAMRETGAPYVLSFVVRPAGTLLDGSPLDEAIALIDSTVDPPPLAYFVNCAHPTVFTQAMREAAGQSAKVLERVVGLQANSSTMSPEELDNLDHLEGDDPATFAAEMIKVHREFGIKILGGCCGTDHRHIGCIADRLER
jgi:homocysteine S-methyltransferase